MMDIEEQKTYRFALHHLGFRPFFLMAGISAVLLMALWLWFYQYHQGLPDSWPLTTMSWHAHEMIYGYGLAVIAGFLLTAVRNWTGVQTLKGVPLLLLALLWLLARVAPLIDHPDSLYLMASLDLAFNAFLCVALLYPIIKVRQWMQFGVWSKILLLLITNAMFYLGLFGLMEQGVQWGLYGGLYLIVSLVLMMGRRVIPFFIEKGVDEKVKVTNRRWVDISSLILMLVFLVVEVFMTVPDIAAGVALILFFLHAVRLFDWHAVGIWRKPLLWVLYVGYGWIVLGFGLKGAMLFMPVNPMLAVHAFAAGGIGLMTLGMMARVALGHTGRDVFDPPKILKVIFLILFIGSIARVLLPMFIPQLYITWIGISQICWILSFGLFTWYYTPVLIMSRIDGRYG